MEQEQEQLLVTLMVNCVLVYDAVAKCGLILLCDKRNWKKTKAIFIMWKIVSILWNYVSSAGSLFLFYFC